MFLSLISWIFVGLIVGLIARALVPGRQAMSFPATVGLGIGGAVIGGLLSWFLTGVPEQYTMDQLWPGWLMSIIAALLLLFTMRRRHT